MFTALCFALKYLLPIGIVISLYISGASRTSIAVFTVLAIALLAVSELITSRHTDQ
ncbi:hypothetical protein [Corynebacterium deserti]|uniref:hypothetical protein n=1 Tax=Corynebacterium deserti TaxID=1408191 RepID=UPI000AEE65D1|nr:hypothetical protein [Corynebacterium deserti]